MSGIRLIYYLLLLCCMTLFFFSCKKDTEIVESKDYPNKIGIIIRGKCATSGCHNDASYKAAGGLNLSTWDNLFKGTETGASVIPYRSDFSSLMYFVNTYPELGLMNTPTMPINKKALSREEVILLRDWINSGAPNNEGKIKFADNPNRKKIYVAHSGCKVVAVFDAESMLPMRYITVVNSNEQCTPHAIKLSPDNKYWYVCYNANGTYLRRYTTSDDAFVGEIFIGGGEWNSLCISPDSKTAFVVDWSQNGKIAHCDLNNMMVLDTLKYPNFPHGSTISPNGNFLYVTATQGNYLYKINTSTSAIDFVSLSPTEPPNLPSTVYNPHEVMFSPDGSKYYVTCQNEKTVRVFDATSDNWLATIPIDGAALEMSFSSSKNLLFVSSWDSPHFANVSGAVIAINTNSNTIVSYINCGTQAHGIAVDEALGKVYVANRNIISTGPLPHHSSVCAGRNGYITSIDLNTLQLNEGRIEVSVDPYSIAVRP